MSGKFIFFGCWNKIDCEKEYLYRDIVLDYINIKERIIKTMFIAGDNWYSSIISSAKYYLVGVLVSGYYKLYDIGEDKDIHIAVGNHDEASDIKKDDGIKDNVKKDCMINTQKYYIDYIKNKRYLKKPYSDPIKSQLSKLSIPSLIRAQSLEQNTFKYKKEKKINMMDLFKDDELPSIEKLQKENEQY